MMMMMMMMTYMCCTGLSIRALVQFGSFMGRDESVRVMLLEGINMFSRVCSRRRSNVKYRSNQYKTTLQKNQ